MLKNFNASVNHFTEFIKGAFEKDNNLKIISIILATIIWMVVSITIYPTTERPVYNVPIEIILDGSYAESTQLDAISVSHDTVNITIAGKRGQIGDIKAEDLKAVVDVSKVLLPRQYDLTMNIECADNKAFEVVSIEPATVSVVFDKIISKEFEVTPVHKDVKIASGYMSNDAIISPDKVTISGPQDTINSITSVRAVVSNNVEIATTSEFITDELVLYNDNAIINDDNQLLSFSKSSFAVQIPVYVRQTLPLEVNIINAPANFDIEYFRSRLSFSIDKLNIAAPNDKIKDLTSLNIGTINMREVDVGSDFEFFTEDFLPDGYENLSQINSITVTCPKENIDRKRIAIMGNDIQFINKPAQFEFEPIASGMTLLLVGDKEQIAELSSFDITAQIDLIDFNMQEGDHKMPVDFIISSYNKVWFNGDEGIATPKIYVTAEYVPTTDDILE